MKVLQFTLPVPGDNNIIIKRDVLPYFYQHLHRHDEIQITWVQRGEGTLVVNNNMHVFGANEIYFIGANQPHVFKSDPVYFDSKSKRNVKALSIHFNPQGKLRSFLELAEMKPMLAFLKKHNNGFSIPEEHVPDVAHKMELILKHKNMDQIVALIDLFKKFASIPRLKELSSIYNHSEVSEHDGIRLSNIYHYIMANYARSITLEDVAQQAFMTPQAFCRYFKKRTLHTFVSFLNEVRINEACKKLTAGDAESVSISAIAYNSGFNTVTNFNRVFKTIVGKSPSEYQEDYFRSAYEETTV
jgi:AraC-like DNA-binding protein